MASGTLCLCSVWISHLPDYPEHQAGFVMSMCNKSPPAMKNQLTLWRDNPMNYPHAPPFPPPCLVKYSILYLSLL
uniref:Uncharacterized protein n=1 Tax=Anguilla anguilla TaxID=7936 RepID=A0A0E9X641_ANGAN